MHASSKQTERPEEGHGPNVQSGVVCKVRLPRCLGGRVSDWTSWTGSRREGSQPFVSCSKSKHSEAGSSVHLSRCSFIRADCVLRTVKKQKSRPKAVLVNLKVCSKGQNQNSQCDVGVKTAPSALFWCGKVMIDRRSDQLGDACVCSHAPTFIQTPGEGGFY